MADKTPAPTRRGFKFQPVTVRHPEGGSLRDESGCTVRPTGSARLNTAGTEILHNLAIAKALDVQRYQIRYGADPEDQLVAIYPVEANSPNAMAVRRYSENRIMTFHLGGVFRQFPAIRPTGLRQCLVDKGTDADGEECLLISLGTGLMKRQTSRTVAAGATGEQAVSELPPESDESETGEPDPKKPE